MRRLSGYLQRKGYSSDIVRYAVDAGSRRRARHACGSASECGSASRTATAASFRASTVNLTIMSTVTERPSASIGRSLDGRARTYEVRTFGCQMNVHDSERLAGSLEAAGYVRAEAAQADVVVINTCAVRDNADNKLYGTLGHLASVQGRA